MNVSLYDEIVKIIQKETIYLRHYDAKVLNNDSTAINKNGWLKVSVPELGWETEDQSQWVSPREFNRLLIPNIDDYVEIYFIGGDESRPVWLGKSQYLTDMDLKSKLSDIKQHLIFESPDGGKCPVLYDANGNEMTIGDNGHKGVARIDDTGVSDSSVDGAFWSALLAHTHTAPSGPTGPAQGAPSSLTIKINSGSSQVLIGDK